MKISTIRVNFTLPAEIYHNFHAVIPKRQMSKVVSRLMQEEIEKRQKSLFKIAQKVEKDEALNKEMAEWDSTAGDGLDHLEWNP